MFLRIPATSSVLTLALALHGCGDDPTSDTQDVGTETGDGDGEGVRSVAVWSAAGTLLWDSGDELEQTTAAALPDDFNANNDANASFDSRSDNSGSIRIHRDLAE